MDRRLIAWLALAGMFVLLVFGGVRARGGDSTALADARAETAHAVAEGARARDFAVLQSTRASAAEARADSEAGRADSLRRESAKVRVRYVAVRDSAPADCAPLVASADSALAAADREAVVLRQTAQDARSSAALYKTALDTLRPAYERLSASAAVLTRVSRPSLLSRLAPRVGAGIAAGLDPFTRRPAAAAGITLGWSF